MLKTFLTTLLLATLLHLAPPAYATLQTDITAACTTGGSVTVPTTVTITSTLYMTCPPSADNRPVRLVGSPSLITCSTGGTPCIVVGSTNTSARLNLMMKDVALVGPGRAASGSEGIRILATADESVFDNLRIDGFDLGLHLYAPSTDLLYTVFLTTIRIGMSVPYPSVNTAIHLNGFMGNIKLTGFHLAAWQRLLLFDGPAGNGSDVSMIQGSFNTTKTPGTPAVEVSTNDGGRRYVLISHIEDWETSVPFVEIGVGSDVTLDNILVTGDPNQTPQYPAIHMAPNAFSTLTIANSFIAAQSNGANLMQFGTAGGMIRISNSRLGGTINFFSPTSAILTGNWCQYPLTGTLTNVRASGNIGCPDQ